METGSRGLVGDTLPIVTALLFSFRLSASDKLDQSRKSGMELGIFLLHAWGCYGLQKTSFPDPLAGIHGCRPSSLRQKTGNYHLQQMNLLEAAACDPLKNGGTVVRLALNSWQRRATPGLSGMVLMCPTTESGRTKRPPSPAPTLLICPLPMRSCRRQTLWVDSHSA